MKLTTKGTLMRNIFISVDPIMKVWLSGAKTLI